MTAIQFLGTIENLLPGLAIYGVIISVIFLFGIGSIWKSKWKAIIVKNYIWVILFVLLSMLIVMVALFIISSLTEPQ